jgi:hypothetical protein
MHYNLIQKGYLEKENKFHIFAIDVKIYERLINKRMKN